MQTVICMKWGTAYGVDYANTLYSMVKRNTARPLRFICFTDDPAGLAPGVEARPLPHITLPEDYEWKAWRKIALWQREIEGLSGDVLFFDLDVVVVGSIDGFFDYKPEEAYCVIENWTQAGEGIGNTSVFRLRIGSHTEVYERLMADPEIVFEYRNSQTFAARTISRMAYWPEEWCVSFKHSLLPRWPKNFYTVAPPPGADARVVCFPGFPNPDHARDGVWPTEFFYKRLYKYVRPTPWIAEHWR